MKSGTAAGFLKKRSATALPAGGAVAVAGAADTPSDRTSRL